MHVPYVGPDAPVAELPREAPKSAVSWSAILAGAVVAIAVSLVLVTLGSGLGLATLTAAARSAATPGALTAMALVWIVVVQWLSAASGGYIAGRLRTRWVGTHTHEVFFRDTAHGFVTWAVATAIVAVAIASATSVMLPGGARAAASTTASAPSIAPYDVDVLFRGSADAASGEARGEASHILASGLIAGGVADEDRAYLASVIAAHGGISPADARKRVDGVVARTQQEAEAARKAAARASLLTALAMVIGAFVACVAAALGGHERDQHP
jgi:hypothetical protein